MFLIPTCIGKSEIHGVGVFATSVIPAGTIIWMFDPSVDWKITPQEMAAFPEPYRSRLHQYSYVAPDGMYVLCGDNAKYMNHSDEPNCDDSGPEFTVAGRDILPGEEMTCDYRSFDLESVEKLNGAAPEVEGIAMG